MFELNLIKSRHVSLKKFYYFLRLAVIAYATLLLIFAVLLIKFVAVRSMTARAEASILTLQAHIVEQNDRYKVPALKEEWKKIFHDMAFLTSVVSKKNNMSARLSEIPRMLPLGICFQTMAVSLESITASVVVVPLGRIEYDIVSEYIGAIEKNRNFVKGVKISSREKRDFKGKRSEFYQLVIPFNK